MERCLIGDHRNRVVRRGHNLYLVVWSNSETWQHVARQLMKRCHLQETVSDKWPKNWIFKGNLYTLLHLPIRNRSYLWGIHPGWCMSSSQEGLRKTKLFLSPIHRCGSPLFWGKRSFHCGCWMYGPFGCMRGRAQGDPASRSTAHPRKMTGDPTSTNKVSRSRKEKK